MRLALALLLAALPAAAQEGRRAFEDHCASCHAVDRAAPPGPGPNLAGVIGRVVGGAEGFDYSPVLEAARAAGDRWDAARLGRFLEDPEEMYPGLWMGGNGARSPADRAAIVAFLQSTR